MEPCSPLFSGTALTGVLSNLPPRPQFSGQLQRFGPAGLAMAAHAAGLLGGSPGRKLLAKACESAMALGSAAAAVAAQQAGSKQQEATAGASVLSIFGPDELGAFMVAAARLNTPPPKAFLAAWMGEAAARMQQELEDVASSLDEGDASTEIAMQAHASAAGVAAVAGEEAADVLGVLEHHMPGMDGQAEEGVSGALASGLEPAQSEDAAGAEGSSQPMLQQQHHKGLAMGHQAAASQGADNNSRWLSAPTLAVYAWSLAKLGLRPKGAWRALMGVCLQRRLDQGGLGARELVMAASALAAWKSPVGIVLRTSWLLHDRAKR